MVGGSESVRVRVWGCVCVFVSTSVSDRVGQTSCLVIVPALYAIGCQSISAGVYASLVMVNICARIGLIP